MSTIVTQPRGTRLVPLAACWLLILAAADSTRGRAETPARAVRLQSSELNESSGIGQTGPLIWTHNDSGDAPRLFAFTHDGSLHARYTVRGALAIDWEDMCAFERDGKRYLAVGDIGDNSAQRKSVRVYVVEVPPSLLAEAAPPSASSPPNLPNGPAVKELTVQAIFEVTYPTGPVNCEALAYDPLTHSFLLATKELLNCRLFRVAADTLSGTRAVKAEFVGSLFLPLVTGGDISPDGKQLVLSTYGPGCLLQRQNDELGQPAEWQTRAVSAAHIFALPTRQQGESISFSMDGQRLWLTSEGVPTPLFNLAVPQLDQETDQP